MGCEELIASLRKAGERKIAALWEEAEREAGHYRSERAARSGRLRTDTERSLESGQKDLLRAALEDARGRSRRLRLVAEKTLSDRLFAVAASMLKALRSSDNPGTFDRLVSELPPLAWRIVRVNPGDIGLGRTHFAGAEIVPDEAITGGVDAEAEGGMIRVVNTFEKRLERAWTDMLPLLIRDVCEEVSDGHPDDA